MRSASCPVTICDEDVHDNARFTPYAGRTIEGWPVTVPRRGEVSADGGRLSAKAGSGRFLARAAGAAAEPTSLHAPEFDPKRNFGARPLD